MPRRRISSSHFELDESKLPFFQLCDEQPGGVGGERETYNAIGLHIGPFVVSVDMDFVCDVRGDDENDLVPLVDLHTLYAAHHFTVSDVDPYGPRLVLG